MRVTRTPGRRATRACPCGFLGDVSGRCRCAPPEIARYRARISGPLLDRIDLRVEVPAVPNEELLGDDALRDAATGTAHLAQRVRAARELQYRRAGKLNADLASSDMQSVCRLDRHCRALLSQARIRFDLSARGVHRVLRVARTIADLALDRAADEESRPIGPAELAEALQLRRTPC